VTVRDSVPRRRALVVYLSAAALSIALYYAVAHLPRGGNILQLCLYDLLTGSGAVAIGIGIRRYQPRGRWAWWLIALGQFLPALGETIYGVGIQTNPDLPYNFMTDPFYLASYPLMVVGLAWLVRLRTPEWDAPSLIDAGIIAISAALLSWIFLISPVTGAVELSSWDRFVGVVYPVMDLLLLIVAARLVLGGGTRSAPFWFLCTGLGLLMVTDVVYTVVSYLGTYEPGDLLDSGWLLSAAVLGAAGLHPSMSRVAQRQPTASPDATTGRLIVLAIAALLAPAALLVQYARGAPTHIPLVTIGCMALFLLVIARMRGMVRVQRQMATTDALTGLRTRRLLEEELESQARRVRQRDGTVGLLLLDVDHFKVVNDTLGHHAGDEVLRELGRRLRALVRTGDVVARYGGEEFAVLLPQTDVRELTQLGERLRRGIAALPVTLEGGELVRVTVSIGAAAVPDHVSTTAELTRTADRALYAAKQAGRNRLVTAGAAPS
jgi:diguanylate cyclase (GGDEF)-like protein